MKEEVTLNEGGKGRMKKKHNKGVNEKQGYANFTVALNVETEVLNN